MNSKSEHAARPVTLADLERDGKLAWVYCCECGRERDIPAAEVGLAKHMPGSISAGRAAWARFFFQAILLAQFFVWHCRLKPRRFNSRGTDYDGRRAWWVGVRIIPISPVRQRR
jgi:hypothetical protein